MHGSTGQVVIKGCHSNQAEIACGKESHWLMWIGVQRVLVYRF